MKKIFFLPALLLSACFNQANESKSNIAAAPEASKSKHTPAFAQIASAPEHLKVRSFDQMSETMSALTGVSRAVHINTYENLRASLPPGNSLVEFGASQQAAIIQLAAPFCKVYADNLVANSGEKYKALAPVSLTTFTGNALTDLSATNINIITQKLHDHFWGACSNAPTLIETQLEMRTLVSELKADFQAEGTTVLNQTKNHLQLMCTVFLTSSCVTMF